MAPIMAPLFGVNLQIIDQFEAFLTGKGNEVALVAISKSYDKMMTKIDVKLGKGKCRLN